jgi:hypothetical protein
VPFDLIKTTIEKSPSLIERGDEEGRSFKKISPLSFTTAPRSVCFVRQSFSVRDKSRIAA